MVFLFFGLSRFGTLNFDVVNDLDVEGAELGIKLVEIFWCEALGEDIIDIIVSDMAMLMGQMHQSLDSFGQIRRLTARASAGRPWAGGMTGLAWQRGMAFGRPVLRRSGTHGTMRLR